MIKIGKYLTIGIVALTIVACNTEADVNISNSSSSDLYEAPQVEIADGKLLLSSTETTVSSSAELMAYELFCKEAQQSPNVNVLLSPVGVWMDLSLAANGADGNTYDQIVNAMGCADIDMDVINDYNCKLMTALPGIDKSVSIEFANLLFNRDKLPMYESFRSRLSNAYCAEMFSYNGNGAGTAHLINNWVSEKKQARIDNLVTDDAAESLDFALINAVYFNAPWRESFYCIPDEVLPFNNCDGSVSDVEYMRGLYLYRHVVRNGADFVEVPFGGDLTSEYTPFSLTLVLPTDKEADLSTAIAQLGDNGLDGVFDGVECELMSLMVPKFKSEDDVNLIDILKGMGVTDLFDENRCDLTRMSSVPSFVNLVKTKCNFEIDENGACGASASILGGLSTSDGSETKIPSVTVDHPFVYIVRENSTGAVLFIGSINCL